MTIALIMAGGSSARMRTTGDTGHKALRKMLGAPLLEWNLCHVLASGLSEIVVAVNAREREVLDSVERCRRELASSRNVSLECLIEDTPLGTIGAAAHLADREQDVLIVNVDNITSIDYRCFIARHQRTAAAMTIAVHVQRFRMPFGQVKVRQGVVAEYLEKPQIPVLISSGTYVLAARTCRRLSTERRRDVPDLFAELHAADEKIAAWRHHCVWIDINDGNALAEAEALVRNSRTEFAHFARLSENGHEVNFAHF